MKLVDALLDSVSGAEENIENILIGLHWISVESRRTGLSHVFRGDQGFELEDAGAIRGKHILEAASLLKSWEPLEAGLGLAAFNSLMDPRGENVNVLDFLLRESSGRTVTCIGRFPFFPDISRIAARAFLLEMEPRKGEFPPYAAEEVVPESDLVIITGTTLINKTMQRLLELSRDAVAVVLGPSTPMSEVLFDFGASVIAGVRVTDPEALRVSLSQGVKYYRKIAGIEPVTMFRK
ncbi:MAG: DUF364 domain-containing protein [Geobacteraceae bacterium]|nr:DUF364 domain-containing protein [Geobacteraceae bacterium]